MGANYIYKNVNISMNIDLIPAVIEKSFCSCCGLYIFKSEIIKVITDIRNKNIIIFTKDNKKIICNNKTLLESVSRKDIKNMYIYYAVYYNSDYSIFGELLNLCYITDNNKMLKKFITICEKEIYNFINKY